MKMAILVDGGFYRKRASSALGKKSAQERADELYKYCTRHLKEKYYGENIFHQLYRIFYYDCPPIDKQVYHPFKKKTEDFSKSDTKKMGGRIF